ncbi:hypothetical protein TNCV_3108691 [Trichonephila clavipes]|uniref:Uncharacterized protein n=1 Tax=Trichonephila clavipes TaxID=2585209 RepID=A0A8X6S7N6_TRICX|nr:hypothetical protein TNCV_3108691 [Trichonephila clavipes]
MPHTSALNCHQDLVLINSTKGWLQTIQDYIPVWPHSTAVVIFRLIAWWCTCFGLVSCQVQPAHFSDTIDSDHLRP